MSIAIWWTGKTNSDYLKTGIEDYLNRIRHFDKLDLKEFKETKGLQNIQQIIYQEEKEIRNQLSKSKYYTVLLDEKGKNYSSMEFANWLDQKRNINNQKLCFIIGGAYGFSNELKHDTDELISFSKMTFSHQLIRLVFLEQLYRAFTIINHLPYHHE
jgi:23S rRNA (pseudouridine1915-N3)-methyltransferase